jgi:hypothetical protein
VGGEGQGDRRGRRPFAQTTTFITSGILESWKNGRMGNGEKIKNEHWIYLVED